MAQFGGSAPFANNTLRYNIGQNDALTNGMGGIHIWSMGGMKDAYVYGNTIFVGGKVSNPQVLPSGLNIVSDGMENIHIHNNIFIAVNGSALVKNALEVPGLNITGNYHLYSNSR